MIKFINSFILRFMEENKKNEELQSRRDFFKHVAKSVLPILGGIALSGLSTGSIKALNTSNSSSEESEEEVEMGCDLSCYGGCKGGCGRSCSYSCSGSCSGRCDGACKGSCMGNCKGYCGGSGGYY